MYSDAYPAKIVMNANNSMLKLRLSGVSAETIISEMNGKRRSTA